MTSAPVREGYCTMCRKMVRIKDGRPAVLENHFTFDAVSRAVSDKPKPCTGRLARLRITHGMDDPRAAFE